MPIPYWTLRLLWLIFVRKMYHTARCAMANTMTTEERGSLKAVTTQTQSGSQLSL
jgi:hypothetical protein